MDVVDLWDDDPLDEEEFVAAAAELEEEAASSTKITVPKFSKKTALVLSGDRIVIFSKVDLEANPTIKKDFESLYALERLQQDGLRVYVCSFGAVNSFILRHVLGKVGTEISPRDGASLKESADKLWTPTVSLSDDKKLLEIRTPNVGVYTGLIKKVGGYPTKECWKVSIAKVMDIEQLILGLNTTLPKPMVDPDVLALSREPLPGFDGSLDSLKKIPISAINIIGANHQSYKNLKTSKKTLEEKIIAFGIENLYDLLFCLPKRFIDKSNPQALEDLLEGESATIVGKISNIGNIPGGTGGVFFEIENSRSRTIKCNFWRQQWLKNKFKLGDEVLLTGKAGWFRQKLELGGSSIEHSDEAALLPIVPVYKQSESKGITTNLLMSANRELLARTGKINLPPYFNEEGRMEYTQALTELHFPTSIANFKRACDDLAYYELVYMQLVMLEEKANNTAKNGVSQKKGDRGLQNAVVKVLPFKLTKSQIEAVLKLNGLMEDDRPSQSLLNADVGAGKTLVAQLACMRAVESGHQAAIIGPTEILARQLYSTLEKITGNLKEHGIEVNVAYLGSGMKVAEKKPILAALKDGSLDIIVGTTSVIGDKVEYNNLGFVVVDEQQKFGAAQRTKLLSSRSDGKVPDLLLMSATPIPRSTAQVFYGDMELIELKDKPPGRLPIITEWIEEDPVEFSRHLTNQVWEDVRAEAKEGNQTFVITPMVADSDKIDAASVERTYQNLAESTLKDLRVAFVHGQVKKDESDTIMADFRAKKYDVLVASTVVEVGVDIPDATRVVVLSADRLGASSLHQIRGRAGRNSKQSKCYLISLGKTDNSRIRLQSLVDSENGFDIAMSDLTVRGEGKIFGSEQSGSSEMIFASLARHRDWIEPAQEEAMKILNSPFRKYALMDAKEKFEVEERLF